MGGRRAVTKFLARDSTGRCLDCNLLAAIKLHTWVGDYPPKCAACGGILTRHWWGDEPKPADAAGWVETKSLRLPPSEEVLTNLSAPHVGTDLTVFFDGGCWPLDGNLPRYGWHADNGVKVAECYGLVRGLRPEWKTNNTAEWAGLRSVLNWLVGLPSLGVVSIYGDCDLIVNQFNGRCRTNKVHLERMRNECAGIADDVVCERLSLGWKPRRLNTRADALARQATTLA